MIYLCERELGFDSDRIGFPSVCGCRAVVLLVPTGLFGFHLNGSLSEVKLAAFESFVRERTGGQAVKKLYAASAGNGSAVDHDELREIAERVGYTGVIKWASLPSAGSAYVYFRSVDRSSCRIKARPWKEATDSVAANKRARNTGADGLSRGIANGAELPMVYHHLDATGLKRYRPHAI